MEINMDMLEVALPQIHAQPYSSKSNVVGRNQILSTVKFDSSSVCVYGD
jgi:hypothetical protein